MARESDLLSTNTCPDMLISALYIIARKWKHPKCPSHSESIMKMSIYTKEYYSAVKINEITKFGEKMLRIRNDEIE